VESLDSIHLPHDKSLVVNKVVNFELCKRQGMPWPTEWLLAAEKGLCIMDVVLLAEPILHSVSRQLFDRE